MFNKRLLLIYRYECDVLTCKRCLSAWAFSFRNTSARFAIWECSLSYCSWLYVLWQEVNSTLIAILWFSNYISIRFTVIDALQNVNASTRFCCHASSLTSGITYINFCTESLRAAYSCLSASEITRTQYPHFIMDTTTVGKKGATSQSIRALFLGIYNVGDIFVFILHISEF